MMRGYRLGLLILIAAGCDPAERAAELTRNELVHDITNWVTKADRDRDRRLDKPEWQALMGSEFPDTPETDRQRWGDRDFAYYDSNGDGFVEARELAALSLVGFDCLDTDRNGRISSTEGEAADEATCPPPRTIAE